MLKSVFLTNVCWCLSTTLNNTFNIGLYGLLGDTGPNGSLPVTQMMSVAAKIAVENGLHEDVVPNWRDFKVRFILPNDASDMTSADHAWDAIPKLFCIHARSPPPEMCTPATVLLQVSNPTDDVDAIIVGQGSVSQIPALSQFATASTSDKVKYPYYLQALPTESVPPRAFAIFFNAVNWKRLTLFVTEGNAGSFQAAEKYISAMSNFNPQSVVNIQPIPEICGADTGDSCARTYLENEEKLLAILEDARKKEPRIWSADPLRKDSSRIVQVFTYLLFDLAGLFSPGYVMFTTKADSHTDLLGAEKDMLPDLVKQFPNSQMIEELQANFTDGANRVKGKGRRLGTLSIEYDFKAQRSKWRQIWANMSFDKITEAGGWGGNFGPLVSTLPQSVWIEWMRGDTCPTCLIDLHPLFFPQYESVLMFLVAVGKLLRKGIEPKGLALAEEMRASDFQGPFGRVAFDSTGERVLDFKVTQLQPSDIWDNNYGYLPRMVEIASVAVNGDEGHASFDGFADMFFSDGSNVPPADDRSTCIAGESYGGPQVGCIACPAGHFNPITEGLCLKCDQGTFSAAERATICMSCSVGMLAGEEGMTTCEECAPGSYTDSLGTAECVKCPMGFEQGQNGSTTCSACSVGNFSNAVGQSACEECPATFTTEHIASNHEDKCGCAVGKRRVIQQDGNAICMECGSGIACPSFDGPALTKPGFYAHGNSTLLQWKVYNCRPLSVCPGQTSPGDRICSIDRHGIACGECPEGYYVSGSSCDPCLPEQSWVLPSAFMLGCGFFACFHAIWNRKAAHMEAGETVLASTTCGTTFALVQTFGIFDRLNMTWPPIVKQLLSFCSDLFLSMKFLGGTCIATNTIEAAYIPAVLFPFGVTACFVVLYVVSVILNFVSLGKVKKYDINAIINSCGMVNQLLFVPLTCSVSSILECVPNPSPNEDLTLRSIPVAICGSEDYQEMIPYCILGFSYITFLASSFIYLICVAHKRFGNESFRVRVRFLVFKFHPAAYWACIWILGRSLLLGLACAIFPDNSYKQYPFIIFVLLSALMLQLDRTPYLDRFANRLESLESFILLMIMVLGFYFIEDRADEEEEDHLGKTFAVFILTFMVVSVLALIIVFCIGVSFAMFPRRAMNMHKVETEATVSELKDASQIINSLDRELLETTFLSLSYIDRSRARQVAEFLTMELGHLGGLATKQKNSTTSRFTRLRMRLSMRDPVKPASMQMGQRAGSSLSKRLSTMSRMSSQSLESDLSGPTSESGTNRPTLLGSKGIDTSCENMGLESFGAAVGRISI